MLTYNTEFVKKSNIFQIITIRNNYYQKGDLNEMLLFEKMSKSIGKCRWFSKPVWHFSLSMIKSPYNLLSKVKSSSNKISAKSYWYRSSRPEVFCKKKMFLKISQNPQENACARSLFNKVAGLRPATLLKERLWHRCFLVNFTKFLETLFFIEYLWWLLLPVLKLWSSTAHP